MTYTVSSMTLNSTIPYLDAGGWPVRPASGLSKANSLFLTKDNCPKCLAVRLRCFLMQQSPEWFEIPVLAYPALSWNLVVKQVFCIECLYGLLYCFILFNCMICLSCPMTLRYIFHTPMARCSPSVLKVPLNFDTLTK